MLPVITTQPVTVWAYEYLPAVLASRNESYAQDVAVAINPPPPTATATSLPDRLVWLASDGGPREDLLHAARRLRVNVLTQDESDADNLAALVEGLLLAVRATDPVEAVRSLSGPIEVEDPTGRPRRFLKVEVLMRGAVA